MGASCSSLLRISVWFNVSNALLKSMKVTRVSCLLFKFSPTSSTSVAIASVVDSPGRNPNCRRVKRSFLLRWVIRLKCTKCSRILPGSGSREMGRRSETLVECYVKSVHSSSSSPCSSTPISSSFSSSVSSFSLSLSLSLPLPLSCGEIPSVNPFLVF